MNDQQLDEYEAIAARAAADPFYLSDCEGSLQVWHERALVRVTRNNAGAITSYAFPFAFPPAEQIIELDLDSWDPGEDVIDDKRRQDITDLVEARAALPALLVEARAALPALLAEVRRLQQQRKYLIGQLAKRDAASGDADRALREFLTAHPGEDEMAASMVRDGFGPDEVVEILRRPAASAAVETGE